MWIYLAMCHLKSLQINTKGQLTRQEGRHGHSLEMKYSDAEELKKARNPISGQELYFNYNSGKKLESVSDKLGCQVAFEYDDLHNLVGITDASGNKIMYTTLIKQNGC